MTAKKLLSTLLCLIVMTIGISAWGQSYHGSVSVPHQTIPYNTIMKNGLKQLDKLIPKKVPKNPNTMPKPKGKVHPKTGVPYNSKGFPIFNAKYRVTLPKSMYLKSDKIHKMECNRQLKQAILNDKSLASQFTPKQRRQIIEGQTPEGYIWHHNEQPGIMELVDSNIHSQTHHVGGRYGWGGGESYR